MTVALQAAHFGRILLVLVAILLLPPLLPGLITKVKALAAGRVGPPVLQLYYDLSKLWRKGAVLSRTTTWVFLAGPVLAVAACVVAALLLPVGGQPGSWSFRGDFLLFVYLLALARFATVLAALDTGSAFEGMGAAREVGFAAFAEPALLLGFVALARQTGDLTLAGMLGAAGGLWGSESGPLLLILAGWALVFLAENGRIPVDDPTTHLELTMIHEVMVLDHGGPPLALVLYGQSLKLFVLAALLTGLCVPAGVGTAAGWGWFLLALLVICAAVGVVESVMARLRLPRVPQLIAASILATAFGFLLMLL